MQHVLSLPDLSQHDIADGDILKFAEIDAVALSPDEREHAVALGKKLHIVPDRKDTPHLGKKDAVVAKGDFDSAVQYREAIRQTAAEFQAELRKWKETHAEETISVSEEDVAETVSLMSGVPVEKMNATTAEKLLGVEKALEEVVVGQQPAISAIAKALRRSRALMADPKRPIGSFLFLGPTGVGKTHLAKMLADLKRLYPSARVVFILNDCLKGVINDSVHEICRHYGVQCVDLKNIDKQKGHPSIAGMKAIADQVTEAVR